MGINCIRFEILNQTFKMWQNYKKPNKNHKQNKFDQSKRFAQYDSLSV